MLEGSWPAGGAGEFGEWLISEDYRTAEEKFSSDNPDMDRGAIKKYLGDFKKIASKKFKQMFDDIEGVGVPKERRTDVDAYRSFSEIEALVDYVRGQVPVSGKASFEGGEIEVDAKPVFENDKIVVYYADTPRACVKYRGGFPYSWCVARKDAGNLFYTYRFKDHEPSFYFVKNKERTKKEFGLWNMAQTAFSGNFKDPWHFFVIQVIKNADLKDQKKKQYFATSAQNDGDRQVSWENILEREPELNGLQGVFKPVPLSDEDQEDRKFFLKRLSDEDFAKLSYEKKNRYLDIRVEFRRGLNDAKFGSLPDDLKNKYIGFGVGLSDKQYEMIRGTKLEKRYREVALEKAKRLLKGEFDELGDGGDGPYSLTGSELHVIRDNLDYKEMSLESIGKLAGLYSDLIEDEDEDDERDDGWYRGFVPPDSIGELLDRYIAAKGELPDYEAKKIKEIHPSQAKVLGMYGDKMPSMQVVKDILSKNFVPGKGFREEKIKELFEKKREEILSKDEISSDEMQMLSRYSDDPDSTLAGIKDSALVNFFKSSDSIEWVAKTNPTATTKIIERLEGLSESLPPHPLVLVTAPDLERALGKMGGKEAVTKMELSHISSTFFNPPNTYLARMTVPPKRMQELAELILENYRGPMYWLVLGLVNKCPDPTKAMEAAAGNPEIFKRIGDRQQNLSDLINFLGGKGLHGYQRVPEELKQRVEEAVAKSTVSKSSFSSTDTKVLRELLRSAANKGRIMQVIGEEGMKAFAKEYDWELLEILGKMPKEQVILAKDVLGGISPAINWKVASIVGTTDYLSSTGSANMDDSHLDIFASDTNLTPQERTRLADHIIKNKRGFVLGRRSATPWEYDDYDYEERNVTVKRIVELIANSSDKQRALNTILSKLNFVGDRETLQNFVQLLGREANSPFPGNQLQKAIETILAFKDSIRLSIPSLSDLLEYSPDKERTARILGKDKIKEISLQLSQDMINWLKEKGLMD